jgi:hypothetical protein
MKMPVVAYKTWPFIAFHIQGMYFLFPLPETLTMLALSHIVGREIAFSACSVPTP